MRVTRLFAGSPAPVAPLPPQVSPRSVTFSMARSVTFSMAIDTSRAIPRPRPRSCSWLTAASTASRPSGRRSGRCPGPQACGSRPSAAGRASPNPPPIPYRPSPSGPSGVHLSAAISVQLCVAGNTTPATRVGGLQGPGRPRALNEGRGSHPGDTMPWARSRVEPGRVLEQMRQGEVVEWRRETVGGALAGVDCAAVDEPGRLAWPSDRVPEPSPGRPRRRLETSLTTSPKSWARCTSQAAM